LYIRTREKRYEDLRESCNRNGTMLKANMTHDLAAQLSKELDMFSAAFKADYDPLNAQNTREKSRDRAELPADRAPIGGDSEVRFPMFPPP